MKKITLFLLTILISCSAWANVTGGDYFFFKPDPNSWATANANFSAYFWNGSNSYGPVALTKWGNTDHYYVQIPKNKTASYNNVIILRKAPEHSPTNWDKWGQSNDLTLTNNYIINTGWNGGDFDHSNKINFTIAGTMNSWNTTSDILTFDGTDFSKTYTYNNLTNNSYEFKILNNNNWNWSYGHGQFDSNSDIKSTGSNNAKIDLSKLEKVFYSIKFYLNDSWKIGVKVTYVDYDNLYIEGLTSSEIKLTNTEGHAFSAKAINVSKGKKQITIKDKNTGWEMTGTANVTEEASRLTINVNINTKEISISNLVSPNFTNTTNFKVGEYGQLNYQLTMPDNRWYWIVLPFDVNVKDITTSTGKWDDLVYTEYNAEKRAKGENGWINWSKVDRYNDAQVLKANKGYVIGPKYGPFYQDGVFIVTFPSASTTNTVAREAKDLNTTNTGGTTINDNWNIIGTGLYHNASLKGINYVALPAEVNGKDSYKYRYITSSKEPFFTEQIETNSFAPFEAFFVQYGGDYSATTETTKSAAELAPVARAKAQEQEQIYLINMNEARTVVILNAEGSEGYTAGEDFLEMNLGNRIEMIYSFDGTDALAFNHRATEAQSINLGGYVATAGEQTISLNAYNGNAEAVTLIDNLTGETTDLLADNYTFTAEVGSLDSRFTIVFAAQKAGDTTVDCYNSVANQVIAYGTADACTVSGLTAGKAIAIYNTMGQLVFCTVADSETITLPSLTAGNYLILHNGTTNKVALR